MKMKLLFRLIMVVGLMGISGVVYGELDGCLIKCVVLKTSRAYKQGDLSDERLRELYSLWKDGINKDIKASYDKNNLIEEDPISEYEEFKIIFGEGKRRVTVECAKDDETSCDEQLQEMAKLKNKEKIEIYKKICNLEDSHIHYLLKEEKEDMYGFWDTVFSYFTCSHDLEEVIKEFSLALGVSDSGKKAL